MSTANRALAAHVEDLRSVVGSVTRGRLLATPTTGGPDLRSFVRFPTPAPLQAFGPLRSAQIRVLLEVSIHPENRVAGTWTTRTVAYAYSLLDRNGTEVLAFHWQPGSTFAGPDHPHLHISAPVRFPDARRNAVLVELDKRHVPTGSVTLAAFVVMLVEEFGVRPLATDWRERLAED